MSFKSKLEIYKRAVITFAETEAFDENNFDLQEDVKRIEKELIDENEWINVKDRMPDKNTRYAGKHGVTVLWYDESEEQDSGSSIPAMGQYMFNQGYISQPCTNGEFIPASATHWKELPLT